MNHPSKSDFTIVADRDIDGQPCIIFSFGKYHQDGSFQVNDRNVMSVADACRLAKELSATIFDADVMAVVDESAREIANADKPSEPQIARDHACN